MRCKVRNVIYGGVMTIRLRGLVFFQTPEGNLWYESTKNVQPLVWGVWWWGCASHGNLLVLCTIRKVNNLLQLLLAQFFDLDAFIYLFFLKGTLIWIPGYAMLTLLIYCFLYLWEGKYQISIINVIHMSYNPYLIWVITQI